MNGVQIYSSVGNTADVSETAFASVSRGVLALQGTGRSVVSIFGAELKAPKRVMKADKHVWGWHPAYAGGLAAADRKPNGMQPAARLHDASPASVISRGRHRSRRR